MKNTGLIVCLLMLCLGCKKEKLLEPTRFLQNQTFSEGLRIQGHEFDSLLIENCVFSGLPLNIGDVDAVTIRNCTFLDIPSNGLKLGFIGPVNQILVEGCRFENIGFNGIDSHEDASNCTIRACELRKVARSDIGGAMAQAHHGIYWKGKNVLIEDCLLDGQGQNFGNGISVRSSGIVRRNRIFGFPKNGVMYFSDHPGGDSLLIENNFLQGNAYSISMVSNGNLDLHNQLVTVRFNSMAQSENYSLYVGPEFETTTRIEIYGNAVVNPSAEYLRNFYPLPRLEGNLTSSRDIGFANLEAGDLHLTPASTAIGFAAGLSPFPAADIDGDLRNPITLNAGADE